MTLNPLAAALHERETAIWRDLQALARAAADEGRGFTPDENKRFYELHAELDKADSYRRKVDGMSYDPPPQRWEGQRPPGARGTYIGNASASCQEQGCQSIELAAMLGSTLGRTRELIQSLERKETMNQIEPTRALWCEQGDHSFSEKDPGMQVLTMQRKGPDGEKVTESRTTCGKCAAIVMTRIGQAQNATAPAELRAGDFAGTGE